MTMIIGNGDVVDDDDACVHAYIHRFGCFSIHTYIHTYIHTNKQINK